MSLIVPTPPQGIARLRFVTTKDSWISRAIRLDSRGAVSHVEAVMPDGSIIGSHIDSGVARFTNDYDKTSTLQILVDLPMANIPDHGHTFALWQEFLKSRIGWAYDVEAIVGFLTHDDDRHTQGTLICSALQVDALRHCEWFPNKLAQKYHAITPVVLLLMLQADPRSIIHETEEVAIHPEMEDYRSF